MLNSTRSRLGRECKGWNVKHKAICVRIFQTVNLWRAVQMFEKHSHKHVNTGLQRKTRATNNKALSSDNGGVCVCARYQSILSLIRLQNADLYKSTPKLCVRILVIHLKKPLHPSRNKRANTAATPRRQCPFSKVRLIRVTKCLFMNICVTNLINYIGKLPYEILYKHVIHF